MTSEYDDPLDSLSKPTVERIGEEFHLTWTEGVKMVITKFYEHRDYHVDAEITIEDSQEIDPHLLGPQRFALTRSPRGLLTDLADVSSREDWKQRLGQASFYVMREHRRGEPMIKLGSLERPKTPKYRIDPIAFDGTPTLIYGPGGIGKSIFMLYLATMVHNGVSDEAGIGVNQGKVLFLDYETTEGENWLRSYDVLTGLGLPKETMAERINSMVYYRFCKMPLVQEVEQLQKMVAQENIELVVVDSAGVACGGEPENANSTLNYFSALRSLGTTEKPITSVTIGHVAKGFGASSTGPFGSVYWINIPRSTWELKKSQKEGSNTIDLALHHRKVNMGPLHKPMGFRLNYKNGVHMERLTQVASTTDSITSQAYEKLDSNNGAYQGGITTQDLADLLEYGNTRSLSAMLSRDTRFEFSEDTKRWALVDW